MSGGKLRSGRKFAAASRGPEPYVLLASLALLVTAILTCFVVGPLKLPIGDVIHVIAAQSGLVDYGDLSRRDIAVVWDLRLPRILMACVVGASLAAAGAALQGLFGNVLADPGVIGVSSGASLGAVAAIVVGADVMGRWTVTGAAFIGGCLATALIYALARSDRAGATTTMLLVGIAIGAGCSAATGFFTYISNTTQLEQLTFWQMGSLARVSWAELKAASPAFAIGLAGLFRLGRPLDLLALGERQARHLGLDVHRTRLLLIVLAALLVGSAVAFAGAVGFVGLVVPHIVRLMIGPGHRWLLPIAAVLGAMLIVIADTAARTLDSPMEVPLGLFTAAIGAPFFLWLIRRRRPDGGG